MKEIFIHFLILLTSVYGNGELSILHHSKSIIFKGHDHLKQSTLKELYAAALGFTTEQYSNWDGFYIEDPFELPKAVVTIVVDGVISIGSTKGHHFPLKTDEDEQTIFESLERRVLERFPDSENNLVRIDLSKGIDQIRKHKIFEDVKTSKLKKTHTLKNNVDEDREFLKEVTLLKTISNNIETKITTNNIPSIYWFKIVGFHAIYDLYGENSTQINEAKQILNDVIIDLNDAFKKMYDGNVLVNVLTSDTSHTRRTRSAAEEKEDGSETKFDQLNLAKPYSKDFPVIFNIILWFGVAMFFTLLAICLAIGNMDPGRDSIIYRMTSTRMKKDN